MELLSLTQCKSSFADLLSEQWSTALPGIAIHGHLLIRGRGEQVLDCRLAVRSPELTDFLHNILPQLGLSQIAKLLEQDIFCELVDTQSWLKAYGVPDSAQARKNLELLSQLPDRFQMWVDEKKLGYREIAVLAVVQDPEPIRDAVSKIPELGLSRQHGTKALEWICELSAMGLSSDKLTAASSDGQTGWLEALRQLRYPTSSALDSSQAREARAMRWPKDVKGAWSRRGDISGLEIRLFVSSPEDFSKKVEKIQALKTELEENFFSSKVD